MAPSRQGHPAPSRGTAARTAARTSGSSSSVGGTVNEGTGATANPVTGLHVAGTAVDGQGNATAATGRRRSARVPPPPLHPDEREIAQTLLGGFGGDPDPEETAFLQGVATVNGSAKFLDRKMLDMKVNWYVLYRAVEDKGGFDEMARSRGSWARVAERMFGPQSTHRKLSSRLKTLYRKVLLRYEFKQKDERESRERDGKLREELVKAEEGDELSVLEEGSAAGGAFGAAQAHADANAGEGGLSINQRFQDLLMSWSTSANTKREALKGLGMYHGYDEFQGVMDHIQAVHDSVSDGTGDTKSVLIYGRNGIGKSTIIQCLLRLGEVPQVRYVQLVASHEEYAEELEAVQYLRTKRLSRSSEQPQAEAGDEDEEEAADWEVTPIDPALQERALQLKEAEEESTKALRSYCEGGLRSLQGLEPFLLPTGNLLGSTTATCTKIRYGRRYQLLLVYEEESEIRRQLETFQWGEMARLGSTTEGLVDEKARMEYDYHKRLYAAVTGAKASEGGSASSGHTGPASQASSASVLTAMDVDEDEDDEADGGGWLQGLTAEKRAEVAMETDAAYPTEDLQEGQLPVCADFKAVLGQAHVFVGPGDDVVQDRLYIKELIKDKLSEPQAVVLKEVVLFTPCVLLEGNMEVVDSPGADDADPVKYRNLVEAVERADHIVVMLEKDLQAAAGTTELLVKNGVIRRRLQLTGEKPVQLSFVICSEKEERLLGTDVINEGWAVPFTEKYKEAVGSIQRSLMTLDKDAYREAGKDVASLRPDTSSLITCCYPLLFTSLMLNEPYRRLHSNSIATMLERTQGTELFRVLAGHGQEDVSAKCFEMKADLQERVGEVEEYTKHEKIRLPPEICAMAKGAWSVNLRLQTVARISDSFDKCEGVKACQKMSTVGSLSATYEQRLKELLDLIVKGLNAAQEEVLLLLSEIEESAREKAAARKGAPKGARSSGRVAGKSQQRPISDAEILQVMLQPFSARKRGRDRDLPWQSITLAAIQGVSFKEAVTALCGEFKSSIKFMQDSFAARFKREVKQALVQVRPDAAGTAKGRHVGASSSASAPLNQAEGSAAHDDDYDQVLDDRLDWFHQVRLKDLLGKWGEAFPDWKEEDAMRGFIENEVKEVMLECMSKLVCPARKSGQVKARIEAAYKAAREEIQNRLPVMLQHDWQMKWRSIRSKAERKGGELYVIVRDFMKGTSRNEVLHSESSASLLDLLRRSLDDVELFIKGLKARTSGRAIELSRQLLASLSCANHPLAALCIRAAKLAAPARELAAAQPEAGSPPAAYVRLLTALSEAGCLTGLVSELPRVVVHPVPRDPQHPAAQVLLALGQLVNHDPSEQQGQLHDQARTAEAILCMLSTCVCDTLLTDVRKSRFAKRMMGLSFDQLMDMTASGGAWDHAAQHLQPQHDRAVVALIEAMSSLCSVPIDVYVAGGEGGRALRVFRVCENGRAGQAEALRLGYDRDQGWLVLREKRLVVRIPVKRPQEVASVPASKKPRSG